MLFLLVITFGRWPWLQKSKGETLAPGEEHSHGRKGERPTALNLGEGTVPSLLLGTQLPTGRGAPGRLGGTRGLGTQLPTGRGASGHFGGTRGSGLVAGCLSVAELFYHILFANWDLSSKLQERAKGVVLTRKSHGFCGQCDVWTRLTGSCNRAGPCSEPSTCWTLPGHRHSSFPKPAPLLMPKVTWLVVGEVESHPRSCGP